MDDSNTILIDRYLNNQLSAEESLQFEKRMREDAAFKAEVELHKDVIRGIDDYGQNLMRAEIAAIGLEVKGNLETYKPSKGGGNWLWSATKWLVILGAVGGVIYVLLVHNKKIEVDPQTKSRIEQIFKKVESLDNAVSVPVRGDTFIRVETVYHTIKVKSVKPGDTITVYGEDQLRKMTTEPIVAPNQ